MSDTTEPTEVCGLQGNSDVGYCKCNLPKNHTEDPYSHHACIHGAWS